METCQGLRCSGHSGMHRSTAPSLAILEHITCIEVRVHLPGFPQQTIFLQDSELVLSIGAFLVFCPEYIWACNKYVFD
jgi:hypothetical protein